MLPVCTCALAVAAAHSVSVTSTNRTTTFMLPPSIKVRADCIKRIVMISVSFRDQSRQSRDGYEKLDLYWPRYEACAHRDARVRSCRVDDHRAALHNGIAGARSVTIDAVDD